MKRKAVETARAVYNKINPSFENVCKMSLSSALINIREVNIEEKNQSTREENNREIFIESPIEAEWAKSDVVRYCIMLPNLFNTASFFLIRSY